MSDFILEIKPNTGLNSLTFGATREEAGHAFGKAEETESIESGDGDYKTEVWHYWQKGFSLFFDENAGYKFTCAEIDDREAVLWGKKIFSLSEQEITGLFKKNGFSQIDTEVHEWGERRVSFDDALVDLYFENGKLISVNYGILSSSGDDKILIFPN
jgi:hypothetical protein